MARAEVLDQPIYASYKYYDLARGAFAKALEMGARDPNVLLNRLVRHHQELYKMSCIYGLIDRARL